LPIAGNERHGGAVVKQRQPLAATCSYANTKLLWRSLDQWKWSRMHLLRWNGCGTGDHRRPVAGSAYGRWERRFFNPLKLRYPRCGSRQNRTTYRLLPASADTSTPTIGQLIAAEHQLDDCARPARRSACASRQLAEFLDDIGFARETCARCQRGASTVIALPAWPSVNLTSTRTTYGAAWRPRAVMAGSCTTSTLAASAMRRGSVTTASEN